MKALVTRWVPETLTLNVSSRSFLATLSIIHTVNEARNNRIIHALQSFSCHRHSPGIVNQNIQAAALKLPIDQSSGFDGAIFIRNVQRHEADSAGRGVHYLSQSGRPVLPCGGEDG